MDSIYCCGVDNSWISPGRNSARLGRCLLNSAAEPQSPTLKRSK